MFGSSAVFDVQGALASGQALGAIHSYSVSKADPGASCTACKLQAGGIQLFGSGLEPQRLHDHTSTPDVTEPSLRDDLLQSRSGLCGSNPGSGWHKAGGGVTPQRDQQLSGNRNDGDASAPFAVASRARQEPGGDVAC
jgi:hypothetical protein